MKYELFPYVRRCDVVGAYDLRRAAAERSLGLWLMAAAFDDEYDLDPSAYEIVPLEITIP